MGWKRHFDRPVGWANPKHYGSKENGFCLKHCSQAIDRSLFLSSLLYFAAYNWWHCLVDKINRFMNFM